MGIVTGPTRRRTAVVAVVAPLVAAALLSTAAADERHGDPTIAGAPVDVGQAACGTGWTGGAAGPVTFALWNSSSSIEEVQVQDAGSGRIFADVEDLGVGATRSLRLALPAGQYRFLCLAADGAPYAGATWPLRGDYAGATTPGALPATEQDFVGPVNAYTTWVTGQLGRLRADTATLARRISHGDLPGARRAWGRAHRQYLLLGAAYDAFGDVGAAIDAPLTPGTAPATDPSVTGFPKLEALLWHPRTAARTQTAQGRRTLARYLRRRVHPVATALQRDVDVLARTFGNPVQPTNTDMGLRAHEILEDALRFELTGRTDAGAHLTLSDIDAMVTATRAILAPLRGLLEQRDPDLGATDAWLTRLKAYVDTFHDRRTGGWTPYQSLTVAQRRRLEATLSQTLEHLSQIAVVLDPVQAGPS